jgi:hypothetical protein
MRGRLIIASGRVPYLRAGLAWSERVPLEPHITDLDGDRLLALLVDPVLTVSLEGDGGEVQPFPTVPDTATADDMQALIDRFAADAPAAPIAVLTIADIVALLDIEDAAALPDRLAQLLATSEAWHADQRHLHDQGFQTLDALTDVWMEGQLALTAKDTLLEAATTDNAKLLADIGALREQLAAAPKATGKAKAKTAED